jgi:ribosome silencing factor RsfS/YbeB/iojap
VILDMRPVCSYTDFFVIATGRNPRQTKAIWDEVRDRLKHDERLLPQNVEGQSDGSWIIGDYLDTVLHVFTPEARDGVRDGVVCFDNGRRPTWQLRLVGVLHGGRKRLIAELAVASAAAKLGIGVLKPLTDGERYDLIFDLRPKLVRVQVQVGDAKR